MLTAPATHCSRPPAFVLQLYSTFGGGDGTNLERFKFHKVLREAGVLSSGRLSVEDIDAVFSKCVGGLGTPADVCMRFRDFERGLSLVGTYPSGLVVRVPNEIGRQI